MRPTRKPRPPTMPYRCVSEIALIRIELLGVVTRHDLLALYDELDALERSLPGIPSKLTQFGGVTSWAVDTGDFGNFAARSKAHRFSNSLKSAIVAREPSQ